MTPLGMIEPYADILGELMGLNIGNIWTFNAVNMDVIFGAVGDVMTCYQTRRGCSANDLKVALCAPLLLTANAGRPCSGLAAYLLMLTRVLAAAC